MVRLLLHHLLIPFPEIGFLMTLLLYDVYSFSFFWGLVFWPAILYLQTLAIVYMTFVVYG